MTTSLVLPFKPYRIDEIIALTGVSFKVLDAWMNRPEVLVLRCGDDADQTHGLDALQTFAVFVGWKFLCEGAPRGKAEIMVKAVQMWSFEQLEKEFETGHTFLSVLPHCMVEAPPTPLGQRLNLKRLLAEYVSNVKRVFPEG